jgi:TM2 domain-containing membrane protein YozV
LIPDSIVFHRRETVMENQPPKFYKNPSVATVLSFLFTGLGQLYNGEIKKGVVFVTVYIVSIILMSFVVGFITTPVLWIWGMIDANKSAKKINIEMAAHA